MKKTFRILIVLVFTLVIAFSYNFITNDSYMYRKVILKTEEDGSKIYKSIEVGAYTKELYKDSDKDIEDVADEHKEAYEYVSKKLKNQFNIDIDLEDEEGFESFIGNYNALRIFQKYSTENINDLDLANKVNVYVGEVNLIINRYENDRFISKLNEMNRKGNLNYNLRFLADNCVEWGIFSKIQEDRVDYEFIELMSKFPDKGYHEANLNNSSTEIKILVSLEK